MSNQEFIEAVAKAVAKYAPQYGIMVHSPIIAQAICESGWGKSTLAAKYHNYFGLKCGSAWKGKSVNMKTQEEYTPGVHTTINDNFRVYDSLEDGVKGYFDFISYSRYANLKGVTDPKRYVELIKADGYATSSTYINTLLRIINDNNLTRFDKGGATQPENGGGSSAKLSIAEVARKVLNGEYGNGADRKAKLEAEGYNYSEVQAKVNELVGAGSSTVKKPKLSIDEIAHKVLNGGYGNGADRKAKLEAEGYNYSEVQAKVNTLVNGGSASTNTTRTYTVKSGDTTTAIAKTYGTTIAKIVANNKAKYPKITANHIEVGWVLKV